MKKREKKRKETRRARLRRVAPKYRCHLGVLRATCSQKFRILIHGSL